MYKYEPYIKEFLLLNKEISLEQIGSFNLSNEYLPTEDNKLSDMHVIAFSYNKRAITSLELIAFIAEKEKKNRQIISIDFDSFLNEMRQLLNTGKEVAIDGLGFLFLNKATQYEFVQQSSPTKAETARRKVQHQDIERFRQKASGKKKGSTSVALVSLLLIILFIGAIGWGIYNIFFDKNKNEQEVTSVNIPADTVAKIRVQQASVQPQDSALNNKIKDSLTSTSDSLQYKFIFETTSDAARAYSRVEKLKEYGDPASLDSIKTDTALVYRLFVVKKLLPADTSQVRDSIAKYFQKSIIIEPEH